MWFQGHRLKNRYYTWYGYGIDAISKQKTIYFVKVTSMWFQGHRLKIQYYKLYGYGIDVIIKRIAIYFGQGQVNVISRSSAEKWMLYVIRIWNQRHIKANNNIFRSRSSQCDFKVIGWKMDVIRDTDMELTPYQSK